MLGPPSERVVIDVVGSLLVTRPKNKFVLLVVDAFSKWPEAVFLPDQTFTTISDTFITTWITCYEAPVSLHSNQSRNFRTPYLLWGLPAFFYYESQDHTATPSVKRNRGTNESYPSVTSGNVCKRPPGRLGPVRFALLILIPHCFTRSCCCGMWCMRRMRIQGHRCTREEKDYPTNTSN